MKKELLTTLSILGVISLSTGVIGYVSNSSSNKVTASISSSCSKQADDNNLENLSYTHTVEENSDKRILEIAPGPSSANKADVYHIMLNSIHYFDKSSGKLFACTTQDGLARMTDFNTCMSAPYAYSYRKTYKTDDISKISEEYFTNCELVQTLKQYYTESAFYEIDDLNKTYTDIHGKCMWTFDELYPADKKEFFNIPDEERFFTDDKGETHASLMPDPTNIVDSSVFLFPQNYAMGFLSDFDLWQIDGIAEFDGRKCYEISGTSPFKYGVKLGVEKFTMNIDCNTGVILKYEGYNGSGQLVNYLYTENIKFDDDVTVVPRFDDNSINGYGKLK